MQIYKRGPSDPWPECSLIEVPDDEHPLIYLALSTSLSHLPATFRLYRDGDDLRVVLLFVDAYTDPLPVDTARILLAGYRLARLGVEPDCDPRRN